VRNLGMWSCGETSWLTNKNGGFARTMHQFDAMLKLSWLQLGVHVPAVLGGKTWILPKTWTTSVVDIGIFFCCVLEEKRFSQVS